MLAPSEHPGQADVQRRLSELGAADMSGMMQAQLVMRLVLPPKTMSDAWAQFMSSYRQLFHAHGYQSANAFGHREAARLLGDHWAELTE